MMSVMLGLVQRLFVRDEDAAALVQAQHMLVSLHNLLKIRKDWFQNNVLILRRECVDSIPSISGVDL